MEDFLFSIACPTCERQLVVRSEAVIGQILACPKCASMVHIEPPPDWKPQSPAEPTEQPEEAAAAAPAKTVTPTPNEAGDGGAEEAPPALRRGAAPPPLPVPPELVGEPATDVPDVPAAAKWSVWVGVPVVAAVFALSALWIVSRGGPEPQPDSGETTDQAEDDTQPTVKPPGGETSPRLDRRWFPERTRLVVSLRLAKVLESAAAQRTQQAPAGPLSAQSTVGVFVDAVWKSSVERVLDGLGMKSQSVQRMTWAACELAEWPEHGVIFIELADGADTASVANAGEAIELSLGGVPCQRLAGSAWPHPFAAIGPRTLVTGREELLRELAQRDEPRLQSAAVDRLFKALDPDSDVLLVADLAEARSAGWPLPTNLLDVWAAGRAPWHVMWELPRGIGVSLRMAGRPLSEVAMACEGEAAASKVRAAMEQLKSAADASLEARVTAVAKKREAGRMPPQTAQRYEWLLTQARGAVHAGRCEVSDEIAWFRLPWAEPLARVAGAAMDSPAAICDDWLEAGLRADQAHLRGLLQSLEAYSKAAGRFPPGAGGGVMLPPATRLSWLAEMLPYFDRADWRRELQPSYSWNSPQNRPVTQRPLEPVINPVVSQRTNEAGFPVTHYVGVAGVGEDAGALKADNPRAGVFGYARTTRPQDIPDGASNTLAVLGVTEQLGPWGAGGEATVRALTQRPYVHGPDGFGSGQPNGMLAGMADGAVRFLSKDVDPAVVEQMATIRGGERPALETAAPKMPENGPATPGVAQAAPAGPPPGKTPPPKPANGEKPESPKPGTAKEDRTAKPDGPTDDDPPDRTDVETRLAERIPEIELPGVPLLDAVRLLGQMGCVPVTFDLDALAATGATLADPIKVKLTDATLGQVLEAVLAARNLAYTVDNDQVLVTLPERRRTAMRTDKYPVADLVGRESSANNELAARIRTLIAPESWREVGGQGTIAAEGTSLSVTQTDGVHVQVRSFLDKLRAAREQPVEQNGNKLLLASRLDRARTTLRQPITANFPEPTPVPRILGELEQASKTRILVNWMMLRAAGVAAETKATLRVHNQPLSEAIVKLLKTLEPTGLLTCRIVSDDTFEVTARKAVAARLEVEFYPIGPLLRGQTPEAVIARVKSDVVGPTWNDAGGPGVLCFDKPSACLIVLQSPPAQAQLQRRLNEWLEAAGSPVPEAKPTAPTPPPAPKRR